jgi:diguanylate cyclase (GGDEF)-like protein/PAS domain S-box-containing protein
VDSQRGHILLVDDVPDNRETLRRRLEKRGFTCEEAESGEACLAAIAANSYDLVLLDVKMPGISGLDTLESIRQQYDALALPVIMVTAHGANDDVATALSCGANDYISKPINFPVALARILSLLERRAATERLRQSEERLALVLRGTNDGIWDWNLESGEIVLSERWYELCGLEPQAAATGAATWFDRVHPDDVAQLRSAIAKHVDGVSLWLEAEYRLRHRNDTYRWMLLRGVAARDADGRARRLAGSQTDITDRKLTDPVTGLSNRVLFLDRVSQALARGHRRPADGFAVAVISLDRFAEVQETLGPGAADALIAAVSRRLLEHVRPMDTVSRVGGDKIAVLIDRVAEPAAGTVVVERCLAALGAPVLCAGESVSAAATVGIAFRHPDHTDADAVLRDAFAAQAAALASNRAYALHDANTQAAARGRLVMEAGLRAALSADRLALYHQPIFDLATGRCVGFEALLRWRREDGDFVSPAEFIPLAERSGLIVELGTYAIAQACRQVAAWSRGGSFGDRTVAINVSSKQLAQADFARRTVAIAQDAGVSPARIRLEITESAMVEDSDGLRRKLAELRQAGFTLSLDDFGTGYSALWLLPRLPLDTVKIDRAFVQGMLTDPAHARIVEAIIRLGYGMGLTVVAEGIETSAQAAALAALGCAQGQGFLMAHPMPAEDVTGVLDRVFPFKHLRALAAE